MDKKYAGKSVVLPKAVTETLQKAQTELTKELGFIPSLSDTVAFLAHDWLIKKGKVDCAV